MRTIISLATILLLSGYALAAGQTVQCGPLEGHAYRLPSPLTGDSGIGWERDGLSNGAIIFDVANGDILIKDAAGLRSVKSDGGQVFSTTKHGGAGFTLIVDYGSTIETYTVFNRSDGSKGMVMTTHRTEGVVPKVSIMASNCR